MHPEDGRGEEEEELMAVQVTRFKCGSFVVCCSFLHLVAVFEFVAAWGQAARGVPVDPVPAHDRASPFTPRDPPRVQFPHWTAEFKAPGAGGGRDKAPCKCNNAGHGDGDEVVVSVAHFTTAHLWRRTGSPS